MNTAIHIIKNLMLREWKRLCARPVYLLCIICVPVFCTIFFTTLMKEGLPADLPIGVVDEDRTSTTRQIIRNLDSFQQTKIIRQYPNFTEAREAMQRGEIYAFLHLPDGTTAGAMRSVQPKIAFYTNGTYLIPGSLAYRDLKMMSEYVSGAVGRATLLAKGQTMDQAMAFLQPIAMDCRAVGNPWLNYSYYLNSTLLPAVIMLMVLLVTAFSINTELKDGTGREWMETAGDNPFLAIVGKLLPQTLFFIMMLALQYALTYGMLGFPHNSGILPMFLAGILLILSSEGVAVLLSETVPSLRWSLSLSTLFGVLSIPLSGFSFPVMAMPPALQGLSYLIPMRYYFLLYVDQALNGISMCYSTPFYLVMAAFTLLPLPFLGLLKRSMNRFTYLP